ncbi:Cytochrome P450 [Hibiscus syriacus]|uniref:Cytochrome P450 n=1 Tax=Hibiscus syriacus TaxID=106335 RepID=A0A6A3AIH2_HIBSY|nr:Cytochrome P450 [Hibiscus syriacus]
MMCLTSTIICRVAFGNGMPKKELKEAGFHNRLEKTFKELDIFYQDLIDEHLDPKRLKPEQKDIIDVLLQISKDTDFLFDLTIYHIKAILMIVFIAGTDTSAAAVIWVMSFLMKNPKCLKRTQVELALANLLYKFDWGMPSGMNEEDINFDVLPEIVTHKKNDQVKATLPIQFAPFANVRIRIPDLCLRDLMPLPTRPTGC